MPTNRTNYDIRPSWTPAQNQPNSSRIVTSQDGELQFAVPRNLAPAHRHVNQRPKAPEKMPKARAMALANKFKRGLAIASFVGFGTFSGLVALHQVGTTSTGSTQSSSGSSSSNSTNSSSSSSQNSNTFLNQQGGNTSGTSTPTTSSSSTSTPTTSSSSSSTVTGTSTS